MTQADIIQIVVVFFLSLVSGVVSSVIVRRRLLAKKDNTVSIGVSQSAVKAAQAFQRLASCAIDDFPDKDGDGVPDVFQRRKPLSEMLEFEKPPGNHSNDYWVAIELPPRPPCKGEYYISVGGHIDKAEFDFANYSAVIIKSVPGTNLDDLVDLTK